MSIDLFIATTLAIFIFFLTTTFFSLSRMGGTHAPLLKKHRTSFGLNVKKCLSELACFDISLFSLSLSANILRVLFVGFSAIAFLASAQISIPTFITRAFLILLTDMVFGNFIPKLWSVKKPGQALTTTLIISCAITCLLLPFTFFILKPMSAIKRKGSDNCETSDVNKMEDLKDKLIKILREADITEEMTAEDFKLVKSVFKFKDLVVREAMIPRVDLFSLSEDTSIRDTAQAIMKEGYSRIPVYRNSLDNITGLILFKDILQVYVEHNENPNASNALEQSIKTLLKPAFYTPEIKKVSFLLQEFRERQRHMAIVVDEYGGTEGIVTMEDVLEKIVGDIVDEYDIETGALYKEDENGWIVDARMAISEAEAIFHLKTHQEGHYDTLGGYILHKIGSVPQKGLKIHHKNFDMEILSCSERSIKKIRIKPLPHFNHKS
ncbi:Uncharacterized protein CLAVI_000706 [Candidatus Clavichlamydia salmonicola]|uniref:hemolysin family protein n=1 Tax=Candidatus Clavichlamydia salmonicola TaxID=469812 RepID=UPI001890FB60|nr:hemolysin family protein [Candidatus Clavichlamydia salmonicola]MBF5051075.1 Uncharacterized protein [Candidatus Clavichlamydia salmonicola]